MSPVSGIPELHFRPFDRMPNSIHGGIFVEARPRRCPWTIPSPHFGASVLGPCILPQHSFSGVFGLIFAEKFDSKRCWAVKRPKSGQGIAPMASIHVST